MESVLFLSNSEPQSFGEGDRAMTIEDLDTPSLFMDLDRLERNVRRMAAIARDASVALWPHAKTHKIPQIGHPQLAAGSPGLTVAKLGEAEVGYPLWGEPPSARGARRVDGPDVVMVRTWL